MWKIIEGVAWIAYAPNFFGSMVMESTSSASSSSLHTFLKEKNESSYSIDDIVWYKDIIYFFEVKN